MNEINQVPSDVPDAGQPAADQLFALVYDELRRLAAQRLAQEPAGHTLQPTALVNEVYLRLAPRSGHESGENQQHWDSRGHFFAAAAEAMRRILIDTARRKRRPKHGGDRRRVAMDIVAPQPATS